MTRFEDWPQRMEAAIHTARGIPFGYGPGQNHCCLFTGDVVMAMTGRDPIAWFRGKYTSERGAYLAARVFAGGGLPEAMDRISTEFPCSEIPVSFAKRGDAVMFEQSPGDFGLGICIGTRFASVTKPDGLAFLPMSSALRVWSI